MVNLIRAYKSLQVADFTVINLGSHAVVNQCNSVAMSGAGNGGASNLTILTKPVPTYPYTITLHCKDYGQGASYYGYGLCWRDSISRGIVANVCYSGATIYTNTSRVSAYYNETAFAGDYVSAPTWLLYPEWFRISDDGVNRKSFISADGVNWHLLHSIARTTYITANQVGFFIDPYSASAIVLFDSFEIEEHA